MSHQFYRVLHLAGLMLLFSSLAALWGVNLAGGLKERRTRMALSLLHGVGLLFLLVSGFAMLAKLGFLVDIPVWAYIKLGIWVLLGAGLALAKRKAHWGIPLVLLFVLAGTYAAYLCVYKP